MIGSVMIDVIFGKIVPIDRIALFFTNSFSLLIFNVCFGTLSF